MEIGDFINLSQQTGDEALLNDLLSEESSVNMPRESSINTKNKLETWYTYWGLGYSGASYPEEVQYFLDILKDVPGVSRINMALDILGFYWPKNEQTILGGIINGWADRYQIDNDNLQINGYLYSISVMRFLNNRIGQGPFIRCDIGAARIVVQMSHYGTESSDWGFGALFGAGIGFPVTQGTRILLNVNYSFRKIQNDTYGSLQISVGGLF